MIEQRPNRVGLASAETLSHLEAVRREMAIQETVLAALIREREEYENQLAVAVQTAACTSRERFAVSSSGGTTAQNGPGLREIMKFRLYVAGRAPNSVQAVANLNAICRAYLHENCTIEIIDVIEEPLRALADGILVTPTLVKLSPPPVSSIIGDLSQTPSVLLTLGLEVDLK